VDLAGAATFVWLGMVLAISFLETPLRFRAPGVTLPVGLGIGRLVFRALNSAEAVLAVLVLVGLLVGSPETAAAVAFGVAAAALAVQLVAVRPSLRRRSEAVLAGDGDGPRSRAHLWYVGLELLKVAALITTGALLLGR
jgi:hypothetical protein